MPEERGRPSRMMAAKGSTLVVQLLIASLSPAILVRNLSSDQYSVWIIAVQSAGLLAILEAGLSTTVLKAMGSAKTPRSQSLIAAAAARLTCALVLVYAIAILVIAVLLPGLYPSVAPSLRGTMRVVFICVCAPVVIQSINPTVLSQLFIAQRGVAIVVGGGIATGLGQLLAITVGAISGSVFNVALIWVASGSLIGLIALIVGRKQIGIHSPPGIFRVRVALQLIASLRGQAIIVTATFFVGGIDILLVARLDYRSVIPYAIATALVTRMTAVLNATQDPLLAEYIQGLRQSRTRFSEVFRQHVGSGVFLEVCVLGAACAISPFLFAVWIGTQYALSAATIACLLALGGALRLAGIPIYFRALAIERQARVAVVAVVEALSNVALSALLGLTYGAFGVAAGTVLGAAVGLTLHRYYTLRRDIPAFGRTDRLILWRLIAHSGLTVSLVITSLASPNLPVRTGALIITVVYACITGWTASRALRRERLQESWVA